MSLQSLLIWTLVIAIPLLWLVDRASQRFWRWWRRRSMQLWPGGPVLPTKIPREINRTVKGEPR